jgi:hypothetical protein
MPGNEMDLDLAKFLIHLPLSITIAVLGFCSSWQLSSRCYMWSKDSKRRDSPLAKMATSSALANLTITREKV